MNRSIEQLNPNNQPAVLVSRWLSYLDTMGDRIPLSNLSNKKIENIVSPLKPSHTIFDQQINAQLGVIVTELLADLKYFDPSKTSQLLSHLRQETYLLDPHNNASPRKVFEILINKQIEYLKEGQSWQFAKVGLEINPAAQKFGFKLHALVELLQQFTNRLNEEQIADLMTEHILSNVDRYKTLASLIGPSRFSIRWMDFLPGGDNPDQHAWITDVLDKVFPAEKKQEIPEILLNIAVAKSEETPGTTIQLLEKKTFRSTGAVPPLKAEDVADPHKHENKIELYLPLMGAGSLKVQFQGKGPIHTFTPNPNVVAELDLGWIGAKVNQDGIPTLVYLGKEYIPEKTDSHIINLPLGKNKVIAQFIVLLPGDVHDFVNIGISPASVYALTLGFPQNQAKTIDEDFISQPFN